MFIKKHYIPSLSIYTYLIGDENAGEAVVVDPTRDAAELVALADANSVKIRAILETHVHADFVSGARELKHRLNDAPEICASGAGGDEWVPHYADRVLHDGDTLHVGNVRLEAVHTPGHTPEHLSYAVYDESRNAEQALALLTGDFLFVGDVGRPDLLGDDEQQRLADELYESVFSRLERFSDGADVYPAHGAGSLCGKAMGSRSSTTLGYERANSPAFQKADKDEWTRNLLSGMPIAPDYFTTMKKVNHEGPAILGRDLPGRTALEPAELQRLISERCLAVDVRSKEAFAGAHIPDSVNIPLGDNLPTWAGWVLPYDRPLVIIADTPEDATAAVRHFIRVGLDDVRGYLAGGVAAWEQAALPLASLKITTPNSLQQRLEAGDDLHVLDVRTEQEWEEGHINNAIHIHGGELQKRFEEVPRDAQVAVVCGSGYRASIAASFLQRAGWNNVANVLGGMTAWEAADLPTTKNGQT